MQKKSQRDKGARSCASSSHGSETAPGRDHAAAAAALDGLVAASGAGVGSEAEEAEDLLLSSRGKSGDSRPRDNCLMLVQMQKPALLQGIAEGQGIVEGQGRRSARKQHLDSP